jgi:formyl-CoA transferase
VLDLSGFIAGAYGPMTLADFGADVIKLESPEGDAFRSFGFGFLGWNRGKRGLSVDARRPEGRAIVHDLVRTADVLVENFRPGGAARLGLDYKTLAAINPRLIYVSVSGFGDTGPDAGMPGFDPLLQARSGAMAAQGGLEDGHPPVYLTVAISDYTAALLAVYGICAALLARERTGRGQRLETTLVYSACAAQIGEFIWYEGRPEGARGGPARLGASALNRLYRAADDWLKLSAATPAAWSALAATLGDPALLDLSAASALAAPVTGGLAERLAATLAGKPRAEWLVLLRDAGVPVAAVVRPPELFTDAQTLANDLLAEHVHDYWGPLRQSGVLAKFARTPGAALRAAPLLGGHSRALLREAGYDAGRIEALVRDGVVIQA